MVVVVVDKFAYAYVRSIITSERIELESPGWSGFVANLKSFKTWATGAF